MTGRLLVDLASDGRMSVGMTMDGGLPVWLEDSQLAWPLDGDALEDLRWYLEEYLLAPYGVWGDRGPAVRAKLAAWGEQVFGSVFDGPAREAYARARDRGVEVVFRSAEPGLLSLPWELMRDGSGPVALGTGGISRSVPVAEGAGTLEVPGGKLRVLMVISRPAGTRDVDYQMVARPLLERLDAVRGDVELTVLRPPTFDALAQSVRQAAEAGAPFHVMHFDGHGAMPGRPADGSSLASWPKKMAGAGEGLLAFERPRGGSDLIGASRFAGVLAEGKVPVVVLNACQSGAVGKELEGSVATALLEAGCAAVVAMAYSVYAVAAAEFMATFYESLFAGDSVAQAVTAGRRRMFERDARPSPKGALPLEDWLVPVHYLRRDVRFPQARTARSTAAPSLDEALDQIGFAPEAAGAQDPLAPVDGVFVGRDDLFYQLETAARLQRVVVLTGPGGTGKTELAKGFARWWRDTAGTDDPRLVFWHSFEPGVASFGLDGVITALGLTVFGVDFARLDSAGRLGAVKQLLGQYRSLLLWDNFESVKEMPDPAGVTPPLDETECARLREFLDWVRDHSQSTVIITSRAQEDWLGQVRRIGVGGLNRIEAAEYAGHLLAPYPAAQQRRQHRSFGDLLEWLDGHPLAMRLTLPRLDTTDSAALMAGLRGISPLPGGEGRLSSLGACITYSFAHLSEGARRLLPALSLFFGVADEDVLAVFSSAEGVPRRFTGVSVEEWRAVLEDAGRVGLLSEIGAGMYRIHPALPAYLAAAWHAEDPGGYDRERRDAELALRTACAVFSQWLIAQITSGDAALAYAVIGLQRRTLGAMLGHALDHQAWSDADSIVRALDAYWETRSLGGEADAWADRIVNAIDGSGQGPAGSASSLWLYNAGQQGRRQQNAGHLDQAANTYQQVLYWLNDQPESEWNGRSIAVTYHQLGVIAEDRGRLDEADDLYRQSLAIKERLGDRHGLAVTYQQLGNTAYGRGRLEEAGDWYRRSLAIEEELGGLPAMAVAYHQLGVVAQAQARLDEASDMYRRSLTIDEQLGNRLGMATSYHQMGRIAHARGQLDEAEDWYRMSLAIREEIGSRPGTAAIYHQLGNLASLRGRSEDAEDWYRKSLAIREELGDRPGTRRSYHQLGVVAQDGGRLDEAEDWYRRSLAIGEDLGDRPAVAMSFHQLGVVAQDGGRLDEAEDWYRRSLAISEELGDRPGMALTMAQLGLLAEQRQQPRQALSWVVRCTALFDAVTDPQAGTGPAQLARLARQLGEPTVDRAWLETTGRPLPGTVRDWVRSQPAPAAVTRSKER